MASIWQETVGSDKSAVRQQDVDATADMGSMADRSPFRLNDSYPV